MKTLIVSLAALLAATTVIAETNAVRRVDAKPKLIRKGGGFVRRPGVKPGVVAILNAQKDVPSSEFSRLARDFSRALDVEIPVKDCTIGEGPSAAKEAFKKDGADFAVVVVDNKTCDNSIAVFPDQKYAVVNISALRAKGGDAAPYLRARTRKEVMRAFMMLTGGASSMQGHNVMSPVNDVTDLDKIVIEDYPIEVIARIAKYLPLAGCKTNTKVPYFKACQEGWAPAPTNDVQRAIWNRVHEIPTKPIKIEFDPKRDAGK